MKTTSYMKAMARRAMRFTSALGLLAVAGAALADNAGIYSSATLKTANGEQVYAHICQGCHMADGKGATGAGHYPAFAGNPTVASAAYVAATVLNGRRNMPSFAQHADADETRFWVTPSLTDAQVAGVVNYIRNHFGNHDPDVISAEQVTALRTQSR